MTNNLKTIKKCYRKYLLTIITLIILCTSNIIKNHFMHIFPEIFFSHIECNQNGEDRS